MYSWEQNWNIAMGMLYVDNRGIAEFAGSASGERIGSIPGGPEAGPKTVGELKPRAERCGEFLQ